MPTFPFKWIILMAMLLASHSTILAQDVESFIKSDPIKFSGRISAGANYSATNQANNRFSPFSYRLIGSPTVTIYGIDLPFTFAVYDSKFNFSKPTNRFGFNPKYKWVQLFFGQNSFSLSPYVMSGVPVKGYGVELTPGKFTFTATTGTVENLLPRSDTLQYAGFILPTYRRKVSAAKIGFNHKKFGIEISALKAKDDQSYQEDIPDSLISRILPEENFVLGIKLDVGISKYVRFGVNTAGSIITDNLYADTLALDPQLQNIAEQFVEPNKSTRASWAGDTYLRVNYKGVMLGAKIKRVEPNYRTLGIYSLNDDYQNYTLDTRFTLFSRKLSLGGSFGVQKNNLRKNRTLTNVRNIISLNASYFHSSAFSITTNFSNFSQDQQAGLIEVNDSIRFAQVSQNLTITPQYSFKKGENTHSISLTYMQFGLNDMSQFYESPRQSKNLTLNANYNYRMKKSGMSIRSGLNYGSFDAVTIVNTRMGATVGISKKVKKSINASLSNNFNLRSQENVSDGWMNAVRLNISYPLSDKSKLSIGANHSLRKSTSTDIVSTLRTNVNYSLRL